MMFNKVTIKDARQAVQMFGPAQHGVARAVQECVAQGTIPASEADDLYICVGVFIHWEAADDAKIQQYNYEATKLSIERAVRGEPKAEEVTRQRNSAKHPFAANTNVDTTGEKMAGSSA
jgi:5,6,7,8-tetrahydromethanopterin hydro-lyase